MSKSQLQADIDETNINVDEDGEELVISDENTEKESD